MYIYACLPNLIHLPLTKPDTHLGVNCTVCIQNNVVPSCKVPEDVLLCRTMYKLLRSTCLHCFQLKMAQKEVDKYTERLTLLAKGKLTEAAAVMTGGGKAADFAKSLIEAGEEGKNANENVIKGKSKGTKSPVLPPHLWTVCAPLTACLAYSVV